MNQATGNAVAALSMAKKSEGMRTSDTKLVYPGSDKREYARWFISKDAKHTLIIAGNPVIMYMYRTACGVKQLTNRPPFCLDRLHRSMRYRVGVQNGMMYRADDPRATDLYAETFLEPETWTIIPVVQKTPLLNAKGEPVVRMVNGRPVSEYRYDYRFVEIPGGDPVLAEIEKAANMKFFTTKQTGLVGAHFEVVKSSERGEYLGRWQLLTTDKGDGSMIPRYMEPTKLFEQIARLSNRVLTDEDKKQGKTKMYAATIDEAYPPATADKQRLVLQTHFSILQAHPEFDRRFPKAVKIIGSDGALITDDAGAITDDGSDFDDGTEVSLESADGDNAEPTFDADEGATTEAAAEETTEEVAEEEEEESAEEEATEEATEEAAEEEPSDEVVEEAADEGEAATEDAMQEEPVVDLEGNVSAFDYVDEEKPAAKTTATKTATKPAATAKPAAKATTKAPAKAATKAPAKAAAGKAAKK